MDRQPHPDVYLDATEERALHALAENGDRQARETLGLAVSTIASHVAREAVTVSGGRLDWGECYAEAVTVGLRVLQSFHPDRGRLVTFVKPVMVRELRAAVVRQNAVVSVGYRGARTLSRIWKARKELGKDATPAQIAEHLGEAVERVEALLAAVDPSGSVPLALVEETVGDDPDEVVWEAIGPETVVGWYEAADLTEHERSVLTLRFGVGGAPKCTWEEVAQAVGISVRAAHRARHSGLDKLRSALLGAEE